MEPTEQKYRQQIKILLFIAILICGVVYYRQKQEISSLNVQISDLQDQVFDYQDALSQANHNIEEANSQIVNAKDYAWESYDDMGSVLDDLYEVATVREPFVSKLRRPNGAFK